MFHYPIVIAASIFFSSVLFVNNGSVSFVIGSDFSMIQFWLCSSPVWFQLYSSPVPYLVVFRSDSIFCIPKLITLSVVVFVSKFLPLALCPLIATSQTQSSRTTHPAQFKTTYRQRGLTNEIRSLICVIHHFPLHLSFWRIQNRKRSQFIRTRIAFIGELQRRIMQIGEQDDFTPNKAKEVSLQNRMFIFLFTWYVWFGTLSVHIRWRDNWYTFRYSEAVQ